MTMLTQGDLQQDTVKNRGEAYITKNMTLSIATTPPATGRPSPFMRAFLDLPFQRSILQNLMSLAFPSLLCLNIGSTLEWRRRSVSESWYPSVIDREKLWDLLEDTCTGPVVDDNACLTSVFFPGELTPATLERTAMKVCT